MTEVVKMINKENEENINTNGSVTNNKISVDEYISGEKELELTYTPFDGKLQIVSRIMNELINTLGGINSSLLRRISTEVFIETISNIDLSIKSDNGLSGYDQLCLTNQLFDLKAALGSEFTEFETILNEYIDDYIRIETNPALTINKIYDEVLKFIGVIKDQIVEKLQDVDVNQLADTLSSLVSDMNTNIDANKEGVLIEG